MPPQPQATIPSEAAELIAAWDRWDRRPGAPETAAKVIEAVKAAAEIVGCSAGSLRMAVAARRRAGFTIERSVLASMDAASGSARS